jgi:hypothetical protein
MRTLFTTRNVEIPEGGKKMEISTLDVLEIIDFSMH